MPEPRLVEFVALAGVTTAVAGCAAARRIRTGRGFVSLTGGSQ